MKLRSVDIIGLFDSFSLCLELSDERLTFIHSLNGVGKSTTMRMISDMYAGDLQSLSANQFERMILRFDNGASITAVNDNGVKVMMETPEHKKELTESDLRMMFSVIYLSPERNVSMMPDGRLISSLDMISSGFRATIESANDDRQTYTGDKRDMTSSEFLDWCMNIYDTLNLMATVHLVPHTPEDMMFPPQESEYIESKNKYEDLAYSLQQWIEMYGQLFRSIQSFMNIINGLFTGKRLIVTENNQLTAVIENGKVPIQLSLNRLSAGEKQLLVIFYRIIFRAIPGSLVILDEPEISLHVSWQQKLGSILLDLCNENDLQMLVATHSPTVIHDRWDLAKELRAERA